MRAILVDDETPARRELRTLLAEFPWVDIVDEAANISQAQAKIESLSPELIFLDIQMPGGSGFDLLAQLEHLPKVIFTTAHDEHAVRAFEVNALDYLLKPIHPARLASALARIKNGAPGSRPSNVEVLEQLFVRDGPRCWFVPLREVRLLSWEDDYVRLFWDKLQPLVGRALSAIEERLDPKSFFRANRRQIINMDFIESIETGINGRLHVQLRGGPEVEVSRRQAILFRARSSI
jgi:two-component system, LytTR family, response regulator